MGVGCGQVFKPFSLMAMPELPFHNGWWSVTGLLQGWKGFTELIRLGL